MCGASYFFTVNLADRTSKLLTDNIGELRAAFRAVIPLRWMPSWCCPIIFMWSGPFQTTIPIIQRDGA
jgi:hypothetical protein